MVGRAAEQSEGRRRRCGSPPTRVPPGRTFRSDSWTSDEHDECSAVGLQEQDGLHLCSGEAAVVAVIRLLKAALLVPPNRLAGIGQDDQIGHARAELRRGLTI